MRLESLDLFRQHHSPLPVEGVVGRMRHTCFNHGVRVRTSYRAGCSVLVRFPGSASYGTQRPDRRLRW